jgi:hypothetical protein
VKILRNNVGMATLFVCILISGVFFSQQSHASDRDIDPYLLYVDPVTGKYTTTKPGHESTDKTESVESKTTTPLETMTSATMDNKPRAKITPVLTISGGLLLLSQIIALLLTSFKNKNKNKNKN